MKTGIHVKIGGGLEKAVKTAISYQCEAFQMFSRSPRGGKARKFSQEELECFHELVKENKISDVVVHLPYILNLANPDPEMHKRAISLVEEDLYRSDQLKAQYLVLHVGSHRGAGESTGLSQMINGLEEVLVNYHGDVTILLENTAGSGNSLGNKFEHLGWIIKELDSPKVGVCFDTCHAFAAGYDLRSDAAVQETFDKFDKVIGLDKIKVIHCNDSAHELASRKDRHAHIGKGYIGEAGFQALVKHPIFEEIPFILETPVNDDGNWSTNLKILRSLND